MHALYLASVTLHALAATFWLGSIGFLVLVLVPALREHPHAERAALVAGTGRRLRAVIWPLFALLAATGLFQLWLRGHRWGDLAGPLWAGAAGRTLAIKLILFVVTLGVASMHDFVAGPRAGATPPGSPLAGSHRRWASRLGRLMALLALAIFVSAIAFVRGGFPFLS